MKTDFTESQPLPMLRQLEGRALRRLRRARRTRPSISSSHLQPSGAPRRGFTLLELLIVITMMIFITAIAAVNYFGAMRAKSYSAVSNNIFNALLMARQRACIDGKPVCFYIMDVTNYTLVESQGNVTARDTVNGDTVLFDQFGGSVGTNVTLINMDQSGSAYLYLCQTDPLTINGVTADGNINTYVVACTGLHVNLTGAWQPGDHYGVPLFTTQMLPRGFAFLQSSGYYIRFKPDGTVDTSTPQTPTLTVNESIFTGTGNGNGNQIVTFNVDPNGKVTQGQ